MNVPDELLLIFFGEATKELNQIDSVSNVSPNPLVEYRKELLRVQRDCLNRVVSDYNEEHEADYSSAEVQARLRELGEAQKDVADALEKMNDAARLAFCQQVLHAECRYDWASDKRDRLLKRDVPLERSAIVEFCGLCATVVRLPNVEKHLFDGTSLYESLLSGESQDSHLESPSLMVAQKRLEQIQRKLCRAVGYDPDHGTAEIERIFLSGAENEFSNDSELHELFSSCVSALSVAVTNACIKDTATLSDHCDGGVTRVLSVRYSEKLVNSSGEGRGSIVMVAPTAEAMQEKEEHRQKEQLSLAREAASLQQGILAELLSMGEDERDENLQLANDAHDKFLQNALELPAGPERVEYLRSVDPSTQRLLVMHKLWTSMLAQNGGVPPTITTELEDREFERSMG